MDKFVAEHILHLIDVELFTRKRILYIDSKSILYTKNNLLIVSLLLFATSHFHSLTDPPSLIYWAQINIPCLT